MGDDAEAVRVNLAELKQILQEAILILGGEKKTASIKESIPAGQASDRGLQNEK